MRISITKMNEKISGKLEMLFAHLSINNVRDIKPLLFDAIDEYQTIRSSLTYDQKQNVNFIKTLLYHAEREEWTQARQQLNGAQKAYQNYIKNKVKIAGYNEKIGYAQIHGTGKLKAESDQLALPWNEVTPDKYMYKDEGAFSKDGIEREPSKARSLQEEIVSRRQNTSSSDRQCRGSSDRQCRGTRTPDEDEQGPERKSTFLNKPVLDCNQSCYPGSYSNSIHIKPSSLGETLASVHEKRPSTEANEERFDPNRPSRIADAFQSLYEKEWQHAFTALKRAAVIEETAVECLLYILTEAYKECTDEAQAQIIQFEHAILNIVTDGKYTKYDKDIFGKTGNIKHILQYRKEVSDLSVKRLQDAFLFKTLPIIHRRYGIKKDESVDSYSRQCIVVTWRMVIQDPPLYIEAPDLDKRTDFNPSLYRTFTKSGDFIRQIVWPVLRIYKGGLVLCRGVAQGL